MGTTCEAWDADALELISDFIDAADRVAVRFVWHGAGHGPASKMEFTGVASAQRSTAPALRFPWLAASYLRLISRLPPSSRWRQAVVWCEVPGLGEVTGS